MPPKPSAEPITPVVKATPPRAFLRIAHLSLGPGATKVQGRNGFGVLAMSWRKKYLIDKFYDTTNPDGAVARELFEAVNSLPNGTVVAVAVCGAIPWGRPVDAPIERALKMIGAARMPLADMSYVCVGEKGAREGEAYARTVRSAAGVSGRPVARRRTACEAGRHPPGPDRLRLAAREPPEPHVHRQRRRFAGGDRQVCLVERERPAHAAPRRREAAQRVGALRHERQRDGVVRGLLRRRLLRPQPPSPTPPARASAPPASLAAAATTGPPASAPPPAATNSPAHSPA